MNKKDLPIVDEQFLKEAGLIVNKQFLKNNGVIADEQFLKDNGVIVELSEEEASKQGLIIED